MRKQHPGSYTNITALRTNAMRYLPYFFAKGQLTKLFFLFPVGQGFCVQCSQSCVNSAFFKAPMTALRAALFPAAVSHAPVSCASRAGTYKRCSPASVQAKRAVLVSEGRAVLLSLKQSKPVPCCRTPTSRRPITGVASSRPPCWLSMHIAWLLGACCTLSRTFRTSQTGCATSWMRIPCLRGGLMSCEGGAVFTDEHALLILCCWLKACPCRKPVHA